MRRTKIVATIGPACEHPDAMERMLRAGVDVCRLNLSHGTLDEHLARLATVRERQPPRSAARSACSPTCPGPKIRAGPFPDGGVDLLAGSLVRIRARRRARAPRDRVTVDYPTLLDDVDRGDRVVLGDGDDHAARGRRRRRPRCSPRSRPAGARRAAPACTCRASGCRCSAPTAEDLELAEAIAAAGVDYIALSFVAPRRRRRRAARGRRRPRRHRRQDRDRRGARASSAEIADAADAVMVARGDLGIDCPLEDVPAPAEADHPPLRRGRHAGDHGDADARVDDRRPGADPRRGERRRQRRVRRHRRRDAVGGDGDRRRPALVVTTMARIAARAEAEASYRQWAAAPRADAADAVRPTCVERITAVDHPRRLAGRRRRRRHGDPVLHPHRAHGAGDGPLPPGVPGWSALSPDPRTRRRADAVVGRRAGADGRVPTRPTRWCGSPSRRPSQPASSRSGDTCSSRRRAGPLRAARPPTCCAIVRVAVTRGIWSRRGGPARRAAGRAGARRRWTARPACSSCPAGSTTTHRVLRYDRRGYGRSTPHAGPFAMDAQVDDLVDAARRPPGASCSATATAATSRSPLAATPTRSGARRRPCTRRRCRGSPGGRAPPAGSVAAARERRRRTPPSGSCAALVGDERWDALPDRAQAGAARRGRRDGRGAHRPRRQRAVGRRRRSTCRSWRCTARWAASTTATAALPRRGAVGRSAVAIDGARHFGPYTHPEAVAAVMRDARGPHRLTARPALRRRRCVVVVVAVGPEQRRAPGIVTS